MLITGHNFYKFQIASIGCEPRNLKLGVFAKVEVCSESRTWTWFQNTRYPYLPVANKKKSSSFYTVTHTRTLLPDYESPLKNRSFTPWFNVMIFFPGSPVIEVTWYLVVWPSFLSLVIRTLVVTYCLNGFANGRGSVAIHYFFLRSHIHNLTCVLFQDSVVWSLAFVFLY